MPSNLCKACQQKPGRKIGTRVSEYCSEDCRKLWKGWTAAAKKSGIYDAEHYARLFRARMELWKRRK
jgi:hypothetical protein